MDVSTESDSESEDEFQDPDPEFGVKLLKPHSLLPHQIEAIHWMQKVEGTVPHRLNMRGGILAEAPGLGKTIITSCLCMTETEFVSPLFKNTKSTKSITYPNLVVCSKTVAYSWKSEIEKFFGKSCPYFYFHRTPLKKRFDTLTYDDIKDYKIIITTYETVMSIATKNKITESQFSIDNCGRKSGINNAKKPSHSDCMNAVGGMLLFKTPFNRVIADESHRFANPTSSTFYSMMALWGDKKWNLSGTPLRNYSSDLYSQFRFNGYDNIIIAKQFNFNEYERSRMKDFTLYKTYVEAGIILPPIIKKTIEIELEGREKEIYDYYHSNLKKIYNGFLVGSYTFSNVLTMFLRLRQLCISPYTVLAESSRNYKGKDAEDYTVSQQVLDGMTDGLASWIKDKQGAAGIGSAKMKALMAILRSFDKKEKTLVFTSFKKVIDIAVLALKKEIPDMKYLILDGDVTGDDRDNVINMFKNPELGYNVMFISYKVGNEGLTLVEAQNLIHVENWWTPVVHQQAEARIHRIGQTKSVKIFSLTVKNSIEEKITSICDDKLKLIDDFLGSKGKSAAPQKLDATTLGRLIR